jgi:hypothetical protein
LQEGTLCGEPDAADLPGGDQQHGIARPGLTDVSLSSVELSTPSGGFDRRAGQSGARGLPHRFGDAGHMPKLSMLARLDWTDASSMSA